MDFTDKARHVLNIASLKAHLFRHEFVTPEHVLIGMINDETFVRSLYYNRIDYDKFLHQLDNFLNSLEKVPEGFDYQIITSEQSEDMMDYAEQVAEGRGQTQVGVPLLVDAILHLRESFARYLFTSNTSLAMSDIVSNVQTAYDEDNVIGEPEEDDAYLDFDSDEDDDRLPDMQVNWRDSVVCVNDQLARHNPLIGREQEMERTIQVLCRKEKNNPLHVGEPGVGKSALIYGLAQRIEDGDVPERLLGCKIYSMDLGALLAGTQYRGDFEKKLKDIMDGVKAEGKAIVYIDEIHNLIGAGKGDGSMDASTMILPYIESTDVRFIGATTYQDFNRYFSKNRGIARRFQQIDVPEPSVEQTVEILRGLRPKYETFHQVTIPDHVLQYAAEMAARHMADRYLPDKAIDLVDEACACLQVHPRRDKDGKAMRRDRQEVDRQLINSVLAKVCKIDAKALRDDDNAALSTLQAQMESLIYGQDEAIRQVVKAVQTSKAGLLEDAKPIASLLFVGPTGVGKTEVAKILAQELGVELLRFDMSEYTEKHTVAKLIGSPAGYVGYEDGGLLTDAIRKSPNCVLLLDEIEKAHSDIYNILLQVMDYAKLTDSKGQKADFRNVVLIMTSNAGAQYASQAGVGFGNSTTQGEAMLAQVKRTFKPEFINRLSATVVFNEMDMRMASLILDKKLRQLAERLKAKNVVMTLTDDAREFLLQKGFTRKYGARELDRTLQRHLHPLLTREILFGRLRNGGSMEVDKEMLTEMS